MTDTYNLISEICMVTHSKFIGSMNVILQNPKRHYASGDYV